MTVAVRRRGAADPAAGERLPGRLFHPGERGLDELVTVVWDGLAVRGSACCLVCGETLSRPRPDEAAQCGSCGSRLE